MRDYPCPSTLLPVYLFSVVSEDPVRAPFPLGQCDSVHMVAFQLAAGARYQQPVYLRHAFFRSPHISAGGGQGSTQTSEATLLSDQYECVQ